MGCSGTRSTLELARDIPKERLMNTIATVAADARTTGAGLEHDGAFELKTSDELKTSVLVETSPPLSNPRNGATETLDVACSRSRGESRRGGLTTDQRHAIRRSLKRLTALEVNPERVAGGDRAPVAAYGIAIRDAALDALAKLADGTYGDCETCRCSIPIARLEAVPYARRCVACQEREETGWDRLQRQKGGVVRVLAKEPLSRSEAV
jgi:hypothetical protein